MDRTNSDTLKMKGEKSIKVNELVGWFLSIYLIPNRERGVSYHNMNVATYLPYVPGKVDMPPPSLAACLPALPIFRFPLASRSLPRPISSRLPFPLLYLSPSRQRIAKANASPLYYSPLERRREREKEKIISCLSNNTMWPTNPPQKGSGR